MSPSFAGFEREEVAGVPLLWRRDDRFKTFRVVLHCRRPLDSTAAARSVLPDLLFAGTVPSPSRPALMRRMDDLYGASVAPGSSKQGETHVLRLAIDAVAGRFLPGEPDQLGGSIDLLAELIGQPRVDSAAFPVEDFERERQQALHDVAAIYEDKGRYAAMRALQAACAGEPMAIPEHGGAEALQALTAADPEAARLDFLHHGEMWAVAAGALPKAGPRAAVERLLAALPNRSPQPVPEPVAGDPSRAAQKTTEYAPMRQSHLILIHRWPAEKDGRRWIARALFTNMLGGGTHSRLFREVREKKSLAYGAHSGLERHKGLLFVQVGCDAAAADAVSEETAVQIDSLRQGRFTEDELQTAKAGLASHLVAMEDSLGQIVEFGSRQFLLDQDRDVSAQIDLLQSITPAEVADAGTDLWLDHTYLLASEGDVTEAAS